MRHGLYRNGTPFPPGALDQIDVQEPYTTAQVTTGAVGSVASVASPATPEARGRKLWLAHVNHPLRAIGYYFALVYIFIVFSQLHQLITMALGIDTHILIIVGVPMILTVLGSGGLRRTLRWSAAKYWTAFSLWMVIAAPFSSWRTGSLPVTWNWFRVEVLILFVIAGCVMTWSEVKRLMLVLASAAVVDVVAGRVFSNQILGRLEMTGTTMSDPNDFAAQLILVLPFLLLIVISASQLMVIRLVSAGILLYGLYLILLSGSRGALIAICVTLLFVLWKIRPRHKILVASIAILLAFAANVVVPQRILVRLATTFGTPESTGKDPDSAATESEQSRRYLLKQSILTTLRHPFVGVGAGQFQNYEGTEAREANQHGYWHETHNSFTEVSSELGIPALLFFLAAIISTYRMLSGIYESAGRRAPSRETEQIRTTALCLLISLIGFCTAIFFLSLAYRFYLPALTGVTIALYRAVQHKWKLAVAPAAK
jgi:O-antigen ligase